MNNLNFVSLIGRLTQDNELRTNTNGKSFLSNSIAVQRSFKNANGNYDTDFINVAFSGKTAEFVNEHFHIRLQWFRCIHMVLLNYGYYE